MKRTINIEGMTCGNCVDEVTSRLESLAHIDQAVVTLNPPQALLEMGQYVEDATLAHALGKYKLTANQARPDEVLPSPSVSTYRPLILIISFILGVTLLAQFPFESFDIRLWMRHFMAGFFLVFAFFKILNVSAFAEAYQMYDIVAARWKGWGKIYPFVELGLGISYLINFQPQLTNLVTLIVLGVSSIGVIQSNLNRRKIKCACLGDVFNLPMSTVTIVEDLTMVGMAALMLMF